MVPETFPHGLEAMMRLDMFYGMRVRTDPMMVLRAWADRELAEGMPWIMGEVRLANRLEAVADDDGFAQPQGDDRG